MSARRLLFAALATAATLAAPTAARAEYIVDNFNTPNPADSYFITMGTGPGVTTWTRSGDVISSPTSHTRSVTVTSNSAAPNAVSGYLGVDQYGRPSGLQVGASSGVRGAAQLTYDFAAPTDFSDIPNAGVVLRFADIDHNTPFSVILTDSTGDTSTGATATQTSPGVYYIPFTTLNGTADVSDITKLELFVNNDVTGANPAVNSSVNFTLTEVKIAPVPAPAGVVLGLAALPGLGLWRLRRRTV